MEQLYGLFLIALAVGVYFFPTWIAAYRNHTSAGGIVVINCFLGWTVLGWIIVLAWAVSGTHSRATKT